MAILARWRPVEKLRGRKNNIGGAITLLLQFELFGSKFF
jgi:hypothetical protein